MNFLICVTQREGHPIYLRVAPSAFGDMDVSRAIRYTEDVNEALMFERHDSAEGVIELIKIPGIMMDIVNSDVAKVIEG